MNDIADIDTGELFSMPTSEAAIKARRDAEPKFESGAELGIALSKAVADMPVWITEDKIAEVEFKTGGKMKHKYATLKTILVIVRPILMKHGIRIRQGANPSWTLDGGGVKGRLVPVYTDLIHSETGQADRTIVEIPVTKLDAMGMGSAISFGRRYSLLAALGLATDEADDDGRATKATSLTDDHEESQELWGLKEEINAIDDLAKLTAWGEKLKASRRADNLDAGELVLLKQHYKDALHKVAEPKAKK